MSTFPSVLSSFTDPLASDRLNNPSHSGIETAQNSGIEQVEAVIGVEGAQSVVGSLQYLIKSPASNGGGHVQTANKGGTGQTTFTKGDLLVATSTSVLAKLAVGADGAVLTASSVTSAGIKWGSVPGIPTVRVFATASTLTWVKPSVLSYVVVEVQGGGGGGGGASGTNYSSGGGGGGYSKKTYNASVLGATEPVVVGASGAAGSSADGGVGGDSSFSTSATSILGVGGGAGIGGANSSNNPGAGGGASGGDINIPGGSGMVSGANEAGEQWGGNGGNSHLGMGGGATVSGAGNPGGRYGGGGGGAANNTGGGLGGVGAVIIYEY